MYPTRLSVLLASSALFVVAACGDGRVEVPGAGGEGSVGGDCRDGADNDEDGLFDCDDDGCAASPDCEGSDENAAPSGAAIAIEPAAPGDGDDLNCTIVTEATDPNGDALTYRYAWAVNGADAGISGATVGAALTSGGDTWTCTVTPNDGVLDGAPTSVSVTIAQGNRAPSAPGVSITPAAPTDDDVLTCVIDTESVDPDGDAVTYSYAWSVDGVDAGVSAASVNAARTEVGQAWTCVVTASDGELESSSGSASVEVLSGCAADDHDCDGVSTDIELQTACPASTSIAGSDYYLCSSAVWVDGEAACAEAGVHLAALTTETESTLVTSWLESRGAGAYIWFGFNDIASEGTFEWTSGEAFSYSNWASSEPDNNAAPGDCGYISIVDDGVWSDGGCTAALEYVCEAPSR